MPSFRAVEISDRQARNLPQCIERRVEGHLFPDGNAHFQIDGGIQSASTGQIRNGRCARAGNVGHACAALARPMRAPGRNKRHSALILVT